MIETLILLGAGLASFFVLILLTVEWWSTPPGKSAFLFSVVVAVVLILSAFRVFGVVLWDWVRIAVWLAIDVSILAQILAFFVVRRRAKASRNVSDETKEASR